jgi:hypothetical protein
VEQVVQTAQERVGAAAVAFHRSSYCWSPGEFQSSHGGANLVDVVAVETFPPYCREPEDDHRFTTGREPTLISTGSPSLILRSNDRRIHQSASRSRSRITG